MSKERVASGARTKQYTGMTRYVLYIVRGRQGISRRTTVMKGIRFLESIRLKRRDDGSMKHGGGPISRCAGNEDA
jgi:hypothetical protein